MDAYVNWTVDDAPPVTTLSLNREDDGNSLNSETLFELEEISQGLRSRDDIWTIVLRSQGRHFSTGMDLAVIRQGLDQSQAFVREMVASHQRSLQTFENLPQSSIAVIHGFCIGGGILLALCCDLRIASQRTIFSLPEIRLGLPILWGTHRIVRTMGWARASELIMLGKRFKAAKAWEIGLVHDVVPSEELDDVLGSMIARLHTAPPRAMAQAKRIIKWSGQSGSMGTEERELDAITELHQSPDLREAVESYLQGREPNYRGA